MLNKSCIIEINIKLYSNKFIIQFENDIFKVFVTEIPEKNKVNKEIIKQFSKILKKPVKIISGYKSKKKKIKIDNSTLEEVKFAFKQVYQ
ncbi:MAG: DUF167 family protein [DPANN group archaeon]|nr:DUF167 family protein [DPANN group archaeon]